MATVCDSVVLYAAAMYVAVISVVEEADLLADDHVGHPRHSLCSVAMRWCG